MITSRTNYENCQYRDKTFDKNSKNKNKIGCEFIQLPKRGMHYKIF